MKKRILLLLLSALLMLSGCSARVGSGGEKSEGGVMPREGGVLNLSSYVPDTLNPLTTQYSCVRDFLYLVYESLFVVNEDLSARGVLASDYTVTEGNTVYTLNLVTGVKFHDGSEFDSADVIATFEYIQNNNTIYGGNLEDVASYRAAGEHSVVITLKNPRADFVNNLDFPILPSGLSRSAFTTPNSGFTPIGTGRYVYGSASLYTGIELLKNGDWRNSAAAI